MIGTVTAKKIIFERLFESAPDPILIVDQKGMITLANREAEKTFGYTLAELQNQSLEILVPDRYRHQHVQYREGYKHAPHTRPMGVGLDLFAKRKDGTEVPVEISLSPLTIEDELLVIALIRDITDRKRAESEIKEKAMELQHANEELSRSNRELEQFAYIASHDLQEPLRSVAAACQLLEKKYAGKLDSTADEFLKYAVDGAKRMQALIQDLLTYSRVGTSKKVMAPIELNSLLQQVADDLRVTISEAKAELIVEPLPEIMGDRFQIFQLFQNLIMNALKFRRDEPPKVIVSAKIEGDDAILSVRDNGIGIDPKYFEQIFEVFRRLHNAQEYPGTGIGLATCKKIVERHGGKIWLESELHQGTVFSCRLPRAH